MSAAPAILAALDGDGPVDQASLARAGLVGPDDVSSLLGQAGHALADDPGLVGRVLARVVPALDGLGAAEQRPQATYLLAQARVVAGELSEALDLIDEARRGWLAQGDRVQAVRTNLGRTNVLFDLGRHEEALEASAEVLGVLGRPVAELPEDVRRRLCAVAHMNVGICHEYAGRFPSALAAFAAAEAEFVAADDDAGRADVLHNRAYVLMAMGAMVEATEQLRAAADAFAAHGMRARWGLALVGVARAHVEMGDHADALAALEESREILAEVDAPHFRVDHALVSAEAYASLSLLREAVDAYRDVAKWSADSGHAIEEAESAYGLGVALGRLGDADADAQLERALVAFESLRHPGWAARTLVASASLRAQAADRAGALADLTRAGVVAAAGGAALEELRARVIAATLTDDRAALEQLHHDAVAVGIGPVVQLTAHATGRARLDAGDVAGARERLAVAADLLERRRTSLRHEALLVGLGVDGGALATDLLRVELADPQATPADALAVVEGARSRSLADLARGVVRRGARTDDRRADLERDLHAAYRHMFEAPDTAAFERAQRRAASLEASVGRLHLEALADADRDPAGPAGGTVAPLVDGHVGLTFADAGDGLVAVVGRDGGHEVVRLRTTVDEVRHVLARLDAQHARLRLGDAFAARHGARLVQGCRTLLGHLHDALLAPLAPALDGLPSGQAVVVSADGGLHGVPFHALWDGERHTLEQWSMSVTPSFAILAGCHQRRRPRGVGHAVVVGVADELAPRAMDEAAAVAGLVPGGAAVALLRGDEATADAVAAASSGASVLHLASHAWHRADNPMYSAVRLADRWWTAADVLGSADLEGATVVLSACETGRSTASGAELLGFVRGFLGAGASTLVASLWAADDAVTAELMTAFHRRLHRMGPADALRDAQLELMKHHPHPNLWAPFVVVGAR